MQGPRPVPACTRPTPHYQFCACNAGAIHRRRSATTGPLPPSSLCRHLHGRGGCSISEIPYNRDGHAGRHSLPLVQALNAAIHAGSDFMGLLSKTASLACNCNLSAKTLPCLGFHASVKKRSTSIRYLRSLILRRADSRWNRFNASCEVS